MKKSLMKKIVNRTLEIIKESLDENRPDWKNKTKNPMEIKTYAMARAGIELSIPMKDVEYTIEAYRKGDLKL